MHIHTNTYAWMITFLILNCCIGCVERVEDKYAKYRMETDLDRYEYGVDMLLESLGENDNYLSRYAAAEELGLYSLNNNNGARDILLAKAVPKLVEALENERAPLVRASIINALGEMKPDLDIVLHAYTTVIREGVGAEVVRAIDNFKSYDYDLSELVPVVVMKLESKEPADRRSAIEALGRMGRYAYSVIGKIEEAKRKDPALEYIVDQAIKDIKQDYDRHKIP